MTDRFPTDDPLLAAVLAAATAPAEAPLPGEEAALAAFRSRRAAPTAERRGRHRLLVSAAVLGGAVMISGVAAAATGVMPFVGSPSPVQTPAGPGDRHGGGTTPTGRPTATPGLDGSAPGATTSGVEDNGRGDAVTDVARSTTSPGPDKGTDVCRTASEGACAGANVPPAPGAVSRSSTPPTGPGSHPAPGG
jgi:hypothetical protein